jgi:UDP:flavonoid glycosyltransferase YjiC (YdhE family)
VRIVLATVGSLGDLHPYIAIAHELKARGAHPVIASVPDYRAAVEQQGIEFAAAGPSFAEFGDYQELMQKIFDGPKGVEYIVRETMMPRLRGSYEDLLRASEGAELLVSHPLIVTLPLVAEQRRLPWAATLLSPLSLMSSYDPPLIAGAEWLRAVHRLGRAPYRLVFGLMRLLSWRWEAPLRALRRELGLPPRPGVAMLEGQFSPHLNLGLFDAALAPRQPDWPQNLRITGAPLHDGGAAARFEVRGEAPLVFALGSSAVWIAGDFWHHAADAARRLGCPALLVVGRDTRARIPPLPEGVRALDYVPYSALFPQARAVIHQGGIGTLAQALRSGRPQLIVPFAFDQPDNARRAAALGVARVLPKAKVDATRLAREIGALLDSGTYVARAATVCRELRETNGAANAAQSLLQMRAC